MWKKGTNSSTISPFIQVVKHKIENFTAFHISKVIFYTPLGKFKTLNLIYSPYNINAMYGSEQSLENLWLVLSASHHVNKI